MLYISRILTRTKYMVMDTDDGIEEPSNYDELYDCVINKGLIIKGVDVVSTNRSGIYNLKISPYMIESNSKLAKQAVLNGVSMIVTNGCLTKLSLNDNVRSCTINLADYCDSIANYAIKFRCKHNDDIKVVLVLDPSIKVESKAFKNIGGIVHVDVSKCSDKVAHFIYRSTFGTYPLYEYDIDKLTIIDTNISRLNYHLAMHIVTYGFNYERRNVKRIDDVIYYSGKVNSLVDKSLSKIFNQLSKARFIFKVNRNILNYINDLSFDINDANILKDSFLLNKNIQKEIIVSIENVTTIDRTACFQLRTYLRYIDRNQEFTNCYLGLAKRYIAFLRENS